MPTLRRLEGITYWVLDGPKEIRSFINSNIRCEWAQDDSDDGIDPATDGWLLRLRERRWVLKTVRAAQIALDPRLASGESFMKRLDQRSDELSRSLSGYRAPIWPVIVRAEDGVLKDGNCRLMALRKLGVETLLAYLGSLDEDNGKA